MGRGTSEKPDLQLPGARERSDVESVPGTEGKDWKQSSQSPGQSIPIQPLSTISGPFSQNDNDSKVKADLGHMLVIILATSQYIVV